MGADTTDTLVIGGGQAGLAMSYWLTRAGRPHIVVERGRVAERWRSERWDSLRFQFPNWGVELPGLTFGADQPDAFAAGGDIAGFIERYARHIAAPVREGVAVLRLSAGADGLVAETAAGAIAAANVVVATGPYQQPKIPLEALGLPGVLQLHTRDYRNPESLPDGGVLIVGSGGSGAQMADELIREGRSVWLAVGSHRRVPRRYRGQDFHFWEFALGEWDCPTARRPPGEPPPLLTGVDGGRDMDLRELAGLGVTLTGRLSAIRDGVAVFNNDLAESLSRGDAYYDRFTAAIDAHAARLRLDLPTADPPPDRADPDCVRDPLTSLDLDASGITTVIWATGYRLDLGWIELPVVADGALIHTDGVSRVPGLYFLGFPWLSKRKSTLLAGVGEDAQRLAAHIALGGGSS